MFPFMNFSKSLLCMLWVLELEKFNSLLTLFCGSVIYFHDRILLLLWFILSNDQVKNSIVDFFSFLHVKFPF